MIGYVAPFAVVTHGTFCGAITTTGKRMAKRTVSTACMARERGENLDIKIQLFVTPSLGFKLTLTR